MTVDKARSMDQQPDADRPILPDAIAYILDGRGGARESAADEIALPPAEDGPGFAWLHLRRDYERTADLLKAAGVDDFVVEALTAEETRPRCAVHENGVLENLRGVNTHEGAEPEDMVSIRLWITGSRVIGISVRPLVALSDMTMAIRRGYAPSTTGEFVARLALRLADRAEPAVGDLNDQIDALEEMVLEPEANVSRAQLSTIRRQSIMLRRYLVPQRDALTTLEIEDLDWLRERDRAHLREAADRVYRLGEELDAIRDRAQVVHDEILDQRAERMNRRMLVLSVVAVVFLPLSLLTGLLGINVGGIPGKDSPWAFAIVCLVLAALGAACYWVLRRLGMFR